jgi:hypothetical protein
MRLAGATPSSTALTPAGAGVALDTGFASALKVVD